MLFQEISENYKCYILLKETECISTFLKNVSRTYVYKKVFLFNILT